MSNEVHRPDLGPEGPRLGRETASQAEPSHALEVARGPSDAAHHSPPTDSEGGSPYRAVAADGPPAPDHEVADHPRATHVDPPIGEVAPGGPLDLRKAASANRQRLRLVLGAGTGIMVLEAWAGIQAGSLVLLADAAHYFTDVLALGLAYVAASWSLRPPTPAKSFGYHRAEVVAAFLNALALWGVSLYLLWQAFERLRDPPPVAGLTVMAVGAFTLAANIGLARFLHGSSGRNVNVRGAYVHLLSDALGSAAALVAGAFIHFGGYAIADPILTVFVTLLILAFTFRLTRHTLHILLEGTPHHIDPIRVTALLRAVASVRDVHDLHVWTLTSGVESLSVHVVLESPPADDHVAHEIQERVRVAFGIGHVTVQVESPGCPCRPPAHA